MNITLEEDDLRKELEQRAKEISEKDKVDIDFVIEYIKKLIKIIRG
jgi:hypothetical protein